MAKTTGKGSVSESNGSAWLRALRRGLAMLPELDRLETISVSDIWAEKFHSTKSHELIHVLDGHASIRYQRRAHAVGPGDTFVIPEGTPHQDVRAEGENYRVTYVFFRWPKADPIIRGLDPAQLLRLPEGVKPHLHLMVKELESEYLSDLPGSDDRLRLNLLEILLALLRYCRPAGKPVAHARQSVARQRREALGIQARAYLQQHCAEPIGLESMAEQLAVSPFHLSRSFSQEFGISIFEMLTMLRIERAREMLQKESLSIKEVSNRTGFSNSNYFAKVFRRITGQSPSEFQLSHR